MTAQTLTKPIVNGRPSGAAPSAKLAEGSGQARTVVQLLAAVMGDVQAVGKNEKNEAQHFNFRGVDAVVNAVGPVLRKHGVIVAAQQVEAVSYRVVEVGSKRTPMQSCALTVRYRFYGPAGDSLDAVASAEAMDSGDKATSKAMSVAYRTALLQALCIPTDEPDPDASSYERSPELPDEQRAMAEQLRQALDSAKSLEELEGIGRRAEIAANDGAIDQAAGAWLWSLFKRRRAALTPDKAEATP